MLLSFSVTCWLQIHHFFADSVTDVQSLLSPLPLFLDPLAAGCLPPKTFETLAGDHGAPTSRKRSFAVNPTPGRNFLEGRPFRSILHDFPRLS